MVRERSSLPKGPAHDCRRLLREAGVHSRTAGCPLPRTPRAAHSSRHPCPGCGLAQLLGAQGAGSSLDQVLRRLRITANATRLGCEERECSPPPLRAAGLPCRGRHVEPCTRSRPRVGAQGCALRAYAAALVADAVAAAVHHPVPPPGRGRSSSMLVRVRVRCRHPSQPRCEVGT